MTPDRFEQMCLRLEAMRVALPDDPIQVGPDGLARLVALVRMYQSETEGFFREIQIGLRNVNQDLRKNRALYDIQRDELLGESQVRVLASITDRMAAVNRLLKDLVGKISEQEGALIDLGHAETVVKSKLGDLKAAATDLRTLRQLIRESIDLGGMYGSESEAGAVPDLTTPSILNRVDPLIAKKALPPPDDGEIPPYEPSKRSPSLADPILPTPPPVAKPAAPAAKPPKPFKPPKPVPPAQVTSPDYSDLLLFDQGPDEAPVATAQTAQTDESVLSALLRVDTSPRAAATALDAGTRGGVEEIDISVLLGER